jgi:hypothetical protein
MCIIFDELVAAECELCSCPSCDVDTGTCLVDDTPCDYCADKPWMEIER